MKDEGVFEIDRFTLAPAFLFTADFLRFILHPSSLLFMRLDQVSNPARRQSRTGSQS